MSDPVFRAQLDGLGYGFLIPVLFVTSGARLDFSALSLWPDALLLVPLLVATLLVARGAPALVLRVGNTVARRVGAGLLCATSLPFIVTAAQLGVSSGRLAALTAAAMTTAGLIGVSCSLRSASRCSVALATPNGEPPGQAAPRRTARCRQPAGTQELVPIPRWLPARQPVQATQSPIRNRAMANRSYQVRSASAGDVDAHLSAGAFDSWSSLSHVAQPRLDV